MKAMRAALVVVAMMCGASAANAQSKWPDHPLRFIVPLPAGSAADVMARLIGQKLSERIGQPVIAENRAGASGILGADVVAKGAPDGYMLGIATSTTHVTAPIFNAKLPFDPVNDFVPVAVVGTSPYVLVASSTLPVKTVADVVALAKAKPRTISYSSVGQASLAYLAMELFSAKTGAEFNHVPYKTSTQALLDLVEGRIDMQFGILGTSLEMIREGKLKALAVAMDKRSEDLPGVPTMAEAGVKDFEVSLLFAVMMPPKTPNEIVTRISDNIRDIMAEPEVKRALAGQAIIATSSTPIEAHDRIQREVALWRGLAAKAGLVAEAGGRN
ncbi:Bug family tripartite tricarboxylate transporter substrate binding protein [Rhodoplanes sp. Z2-YC6860]|uniref:Bug family tripartite tricarboxylate transporter substrate binding protein n=1 Tax=Rhodoplanes sp. Z2-YC6860 TaxID=674703 RepID=UPI00078C4812|nr:tripartite tricarboxylate transporter substrate binding protein [Rhodoplanes sp. Z2-YC6860]AMN41973.1 TTT family tricarboxylate transporter, receptor protein [Rhodoplanes sp. Z2-YC6860]